MSTFEGPMMSIKTVNALSHYTDWTVGHGALRRWAGSMVHDWQSRSTPAIPRAVRPTVMWSTQAGTDWHFWVCHHRDRGLHRFDVDRRRHAGPDVARGECRRYVGFLVFSFVESVKGSHPFWAIRWLGGGLFLFGMLLMALQHVQDHGRRQDPGCPGAGSGVVITPD